MRWWQIKERDADPERELRSDLELEEEEQRESGVPPEEAWHACKTLAMDCAECGAMPALLPLRVLS